MRTSHPGQRLADGVRTKWSQSLTVIAVLLPSPYPLATGIRVVEKLQRLRFAESAANNIARSSRQPLRGLAWQTPADPETRSLFVSALLMPTRNSKLCVFRRQRIETRLQPFLQVFKTSGTRLP